MSSFFKTVLSGVAGAGAVGVVDFVLVEGVGSVGVAYDLTHGGYLADFFESGDVRELLDIRELNYGEVISVVAILASLALLAFSVSTLSRKRHPGRVVPSQMEAGMLSTPVG